ncbi:YgiQ family radical SAM protein, partial [Enterococcus faecalis]
GAGCARRRRPSDEWHETDSLALDRPGRIDTHPDPYAMEPAAAAPKPTADGAQPVRIVPAAERVAARRADRAHTVIRLPSYEQVKDDAVMYAHASRVFHLESNPGNARAMVQCHGEGPGARDVWINPPPVPSARHERGKHRPAG